MNWSRAKNLAIIFLIFLNIFLAAMVYITSEKKTLTQEQEHAVYKYLTQNKVNLYDKIIKDYPPMSEIRIVPDNIDRQQAKEVIFPEETDIKISFEQGKTIYQHNNEKLIIFENTLYYENTGLTEGIKATKEQATRICSNFIERSGKLFTGFELDRLYELDGSVILEYRQKYKKKAVYNSVIRFEIKDGGISQIDCSLYQVKAVDGIEKEILSPDEAIYVFVQKINYIYGEQEIIVDMMDIVYTEGVNSLSPQLAAPHYRFYIFGNEMPILINAYTGILGMDILT